jgi:hypothetical protein
MVWVRIPIIAIWIWVVAIVAVSVAARIEVIPVKVSMIGFPLMVIIGKRIETPAPV